MSFVEGKVIVVTGAASGFGRLISAKAADLGARVVCADVDEAGLEQTVTDIVAANGQAIGQASDVTDINAMHGLAAAAIERFGRIDVMINNAGVMPLAFFADHQAAIEKWHRCIDINIKGVLNGMVAVHDQMMAQGHGHIVNISSIYSNYPVLGSGVYQASKSAVNFLSESMRVETRGKIKVTIVRPTGVPSTGLSSGVVNPEAVVGIAGQNAGVFTDFALRMASGDLQPGEADPDSPEYGALDPAFIADAVIHAINQPKGVSLGDITVRATGDHYIL